MLTFGALVLALVGCGLVVDRRADRLETQAEAAFPPTGQFVDVDGVRVHAVVQGTGPDVVLIHGASGNTRDYTFDLMGRLSDRYRVIAFDRPGLGYTDQISSDYTKPFSTKAESPAEQAALLAKAAQKLGAKAPVVVGHSYGGAVALAWALEHPLSALVVLAGASNPWPGQLGWFYRVNGSALGGVTTIPLIAAFAPRSIVKGAVEGIFAPDPAPEGYATHVGGPLSMRRASLRANARQVNGLRPHVEAMSIRYGAISVPTEILHGTADTTVPLSVHSEKLVTQIPGAVLTRLQGVGHMPHHAAPTATVDAIDRAATRAGLR